MRYASLIAFMVFLGSCVCDAQAVRNGFSKARGEFHGAITESDEVQWALFGETELVDVLLDLRRSGEASLAGRLKWPQVEQLLDDYERQRQAIAVEAIRRTSAGQPADVELVEKAVKLRSESEAKATAWVRENLNRSETRVVLRRAFTYGMSAVRIELVSKHLGMTQEQLDRIGKILSRARATERAQVVKRGIHALSRPTIDYQLERTEILGQFFDTLDHEQLHEYLVLRGAIDRAESISEWLVSLPDERRGVVLARRDILNQSHVLNAIWKDSTQTPE